MSEVLCTPFLGRGGLKENQKESWNCVLFLLCIWVVGIVLIWFCAVLPCRIWFANCQIRVISRALETQTFFFILGFKIIHSATGIQLASGNDGVEFYHQQTVKTVLRSLNRLFEMSKELLWVAQ